MENIQLLFSILDGTHDMIHCVEPDGSFEFVNSSWLEVLGYEDEDVPNISLKDILFPGHIKEHTEIISRALSGEVFQDVRVTFVGKEGEPIYAEGSVFPRRVEKQIVAAVGFFRNITYRKKTEEELEESRARTEFFVDLLVHDLTNIHQEILSTMEILAYSDAVSKEHQSLLEEGLKEMDKAANIVSNVRKFTRLYSMTPETSIEDLFTAVMKASRNVRSAFPGKDLKLELEFGIGDYGIVADEFLDDVFYSLFHNSMKFDTRKEVKIEITTEEIKHTPLLKIRVMDFGPGIPDSDKETIFAKLSHRRDSLTGLGLGLTIVRKIIENYGGFIRVEDRVENDHSKGSCFVMLLRHEKGRDKGVGK